MSRVSRLGQPRDTIVLVAMCHNTVDQQIAASTERKYLPILAGSYDLKAKPHEVEASMRKAKLNVNDPTVAADNYDMHYNIVITKKAQIIYRKMIGSRSSHIPYAEANIDLIDFMPGNRWQNHEA